jgi:hypothetical protein
MEEAAQTMTYLNDHRAHKLASLLKQDAPLPPSIRLLLVPFLDSIPHPDTIQTLHDNTQGLIDLMDRASEGDGCDPITLPQPIVRAIANLLGALLTAQTQEAPKP